MLVRLWAVNGLTNSKLARRFGVICQADESPIATFSIRSSAANSIVDWIPERPTTRTIWSGSYACVRMRLSAAAEATLVQPRSIQAAKLNLRIIVTFLANEYWKP